MRPFLLLVAIIGSTGCSSPAAREPASSGEAATPVPAVDAVPPGLQTRETGQGVEVRDGADLVLFYQRATKDHESRYARSNYVHPLMSLDGEVLTEDFPEDHLHQRGVFWAWHQLWHGETRLGDGWTLEDFVTDVVAVDHRVEDGAARLDVVVKWRSPRFREGEAFVEERSALVVHPARDDARAIDFDIGLRALAPGVRIGGSEDEKGYGGFSARVRLPEGVAFSGVEGAVTPENLQVDAGPWVDLTGPYGTAGAPGGVTILTHPANPGFPEKWILRRAGSMQNPVFPGSGTVELPTDEALVLRYRLIVHNGAVSNDAVGRWREGWATQ